MRYAMAPVLLVLLVFLFGSCRKTESGGNAEVNATNMGSHASGCGTYQIIPGRTMVELSRYEWSIMRCPEWGGGPEDCQSRNGWVQRGNNGQWRISSVASCQNAMNACLQRKAQLVANTQDKSGYFCRFAE